VCGRENLVDADDARILMLTREEEKKLIERIGAVASYGELNKLVQRMRALLGIELRITPSAREVRSARGFSIELLERPGLCRKTRQAIPAALRRCIDQHPDIAFAILNAHDLLGQD